MKDLPTILPDDLEIAAVLKREDFRDALISKKNVSLHELKKNAIIGTSSIRRTIQLKKIIHIIILGYLRKIADKIKN